MTDEIDPIMPQTAMDEINVTNASDFPVLIKAITGVMADMPMLGKGEKNPHGGYSYASIDDFLEALRPTCAKHGLVIGQDEEHFEVTDNWVILRFAYTVAHISGAVWPFLFRRTIMVNAKMGPQAFGAAQSYSLKQFMRSLFQIATGEKGEDLDAHKPEDLPKAVSANPAEFIETKLREAAETGTIDDLQKIWKAQTPTLRRLSKTQKDHLEALKDELKMALMPDAAPAKDDAKQLSDLDAIGAG